MSVVAVAGAVCCCGEPQPPCFVCPAATNYTNPPSAFAGEATAKFTFSIPQLPGVSWTPTVERVMSRVLPGTVWCAWAWVHPVGVAAIEPFLLGQYQVLNPPFPPQTFTAWAYAVGMGVNAGSTSFGGTLPRLSLSIQWQTVLGTSPPTHFQSPTQSLSAVGQKPGGCSLPIVLTGSYSQSLTGSPAQWIGGIVS